MTQLFHSSHSVDEAGNPAGGHADAIGISIQFQDGPLRKDGVQRQPNGAFVETLLAIAIDRLNFYQGSKFLCDDNAEAIVKINEAIAILNRRTADRETRGVEGTHGI